MDSDKHRSDDYLKEETYEILGLAMKLLNSVGHGFHEKTYENGLVVDLKSTQSVSGNNQAIPFCMKVKKQPLIGLI